jgi:hypothetical protein
MPSENTSPQAGTKTAEAADSTQPLAPVRAPGTGDAQGATASARPAPAAAAPADTDDDNTHVRTVDKKDLPDVAEPTTPSTASSVKDSAVKAAAAALAAARTAAKKVQSTASTASAGAQNAAQASGTPSSTPPPPPGAGSSAPRPEMHYTAGGVHGSAPSASPDQGGYAQPQEVPAEALGSPRRVRLSVSRIDPWSIMKLAFLLSVAIAVMTVVATIVAWHSLNSLETFATIQEFMVDTLGPQAANLTQFVEFERVVSLATLIALVNIVLMTAIATIIAMLYNITAALVGGVHLTLTDE